MGVNLTATITGVEVANSSDLLQNWWQWVLFGVGVTSISIGLAFIIFLISRATWKFWSKKNEPSSLFPAKVAAHLAKYTPSSSQLSLELHTKPKPTSLRVYLGPFENPPTADQYAVFSSRDTVILDPFQTNVILTVSSLEHGSHHVLGRLDLASLLGMPPKNHRKIEVFMISAMDKIMSIVHTRFKDIGGSSNGFTGVLLAGWDTFPTSITHVLTDCLSSLGFEVYLEASGPDFLTDSTVLHSVSISGLVICNAIILPNGARRDCFDMENLRLTVKSVVAQACLRDFTTFTCETLDKNVLPSSAILKRTFAWCNYHSVIPWIGTTQALLDASQEIIEKEPLSAFEWLKQPRAMKVHDIWRNLQTIQARGEFHSEHLKVLPTSLVKLLKCSRNSSNNYSTSTDLFQPVDRYDGVNLIEVEQGDPLCTSSTGKTQNAIGCFPLGLDVSLEDFEEIAWSQRNLRKLDLLEAIPIETLQEYGAILREFALDAYKLRHSCTSVSAYNYGMLLDMADRLGDPAYTGIRVFSGLHSGFQRTPEKQFWGVYHVTSTDVTVFISKDASDAAGTIMHTYLSSQGLSRRHCLAAELEFACWKENSDSVLTTKRTLQDVGLMTPEECIIFLRRSIPTPGSVKDYLLEGMRGAALKKLLDQPSMDQLRAMNSTGYLSGDVELQELLNSRLNWHSQNTQNRSDLRQSVELFQHVEHIITCALRDQDSGTLQRLLEVLEASLRQGTIDATGDMLALAIFCTMRKLAIEEIYIEVTDRNPLFNDQADQAAAFSELFALGSRCESYFDMSPSKFGELISAKFRNHYNQSEYQPLIEQDTQFALKTAYAEAQIDVDPRQKDAEMPSFKRFSFLSVFAIPALIDILLLTTTGHGLYLSATMSYQEQHSATVALMISLLVSGAIGTWITCGGTYYLASMAFSAMNYFVVTRLLGGLIFTLIVALIGFIGFAVVINVSAGIVFFLYFVVLTTYLCLLAALANYNFNGTAFNSGRMVILGCIPLLFISPITTMLVQFHDISIYLAVLYFFVGMLFIGVRQTGSKWTTWWHHVYIVHDANLREWYTSKLDDSSEKEIQEMTDPAILALARKALASQVLQEKKKHMFSRKTTDTLVSRLTASFDATEFLMTWYSRYSGVPKPMLFSSAWNVQTKVALDALQKSQLGIRFHNGFIHWRQAGDEIGCTIIYFFLALLDKWLMLFTGHQVLGLGGTGNLTLPVGFGLAYYLVGAVLLDFNAHKLFELAAAQGKEDPVVTDQDVYTAVKTKAAKRKVVYWKTLSHFLMLHVWGLAITTTFIWLFASNKTEKGVIVKDPSQSTIVFLSYVVAYTGLLWYQYTKIFCGPHALKPLLAGLAVGLPVGFIMHHELPDFPYSDIVALGSATWTVALLSLWAGKIVGNPDEDHLPVIKGTFHAYNGPAPDKCWSQAELRGVYDKLSVLPERERIPVDCNSAFGKHLILVLENCKEMEVSQLTADAFPQRQQLLETSSKLFLDGVISIELVSVDHLTKYDNAMRSVSLSFDGKVRLLVGCETRRIPLSQQEPLSGIHQDVGEILIQATAEQFLGFNTRDAILAQNLWSTHGMEKSSSSVVTILERQLRLAAEAGTTAPLIAYLRKQLLQDLCLGIDCDVEWEQLSSGVRQCLIDRCLGCPTNPTLSSTQISSLCTKLRVSNFKTHISRCNYAAYHSAASLAHALSWLATDGSQQSSQNLKRFRSLADLLGARKRPAKQPLYDRLRKNLGSVYHTAGVLAKFFAVGFVADPEYQREVNCTFSRGPWILQTLPRVFFNTIWIVSKTFQDLMLPAFMFKRRDNVKTLWKNIQGKEVSLRRKRVTIRNLEGVYTGFIHNVDENTFKLHQYKGDHKHEPSTRSDMCSINMYSKNMSLLRRIEMQNGNTINDYNYEYRRADSTQPKRLSKSEVRTSPITRSCTAGENNQQDVNYNSKGQIDSGSYFRDGNLIRFQYHYKKGSKVDGALLRAEFVLPHMSVTASWCAAPLRKPENLDTWIPHSQVTEATFVVGADVWESRYSYDHKFHPTILTTLNGLKVDTPPLILHDHLGVLSRPKNLSFVDDNPLFSFTSIHPTVISRWLGLSTRRYPITTSQARSLLWKAWKSDPKFDGVIARWLDERLLRQDATLGPYWWKRDIGDLDAAVAFLDDNRDAVFASVDLDNTISSWTPLAIKINDLHSFSQGGSACSRTRSEVTVQDDTENALHVLAIDTGTWPNEGGGVSACRSDVINNLQTIKWHMVAESANDFGLPKRQTERNVHSLKVIPLWGLDQNNPIHGLFADRLDSEIEHITTHATLLEIEREFIPVLSALISAARALDFSNCDVKQATRALVNLNAYFKNGRHWGETWKSEAVKNSWRKLWLSQTTANAQPSSQWLRTELPTLGQLDQGLELWSRYLFIFSIPLPQKIPTVFQASHHSVSAAYGVVCKVKRGCTLQIWDHAISWRETNLYLSSALCPLAPFVRNSLLGLMRMTSVLILHHSDTILPCADFFNPGWEVEIGTCQGRIEHRDKFRRKIDPVVNGITDMSRFAPVKEINTTLPTVTMLSHIWYAKDIKTALLSADIIINKWGFKDYRLEVFGAVDKSPPYTSQCQEIIATKSLRDQVALKGEADPIHVLERTWVFLNSSISEGLPLALGEAALTGAPVVCTDVGASLRVLTDPVNNTCFSEVVAPNDALAMARAQIKILALLEEWSQYADPLGTQDASFPEYPTEDDVARITQRMYDQKDARRRLGMMSRDIVMKSFSGERYLREHEQMLWIGKSRNDMTHATASRPTTLFPPPAVQIANEASLSILSSGRQSLAMHRVPSLGYGTSSTIPSCLTSYGPSSIATPVQLQEEWFEKGVVRPPMTMVVNEPGKMAIGNGFRRLSVHSSMTMDVMT